MTTQDMTLERLEAVFAAYGAAPARWPEDEREAVEALIARSDRARAALAQAAHLDRLLDAAPAAPDSDVLAARLRAMMADDEKAASVIPFRPRTRPAAARPWHASGLARAAVFALAVVGGIGIGVAVPDEQLLYPTATTEQDTPQPADTVSLTSSENDLLAGYDGTLDGTDAGDFATDDTVFGTPVLASLMQTGAPGFATVTYVEDPSDVEGMALAALPLQ